MNVLKSNPLSRTFIPIITLPLLVFVVLHEAVEKMATHFDVVGGFVLQRAVPRNIHPCAFIFAQFVTVEAVVEIASVYHFEDIRIVVAGIA